MMNYQVTEKHICEHCNRTFIRETSYARHICEQKRRWLDKDKPANRLAYSSWKYYYEKHHPNKKSLTYKDFLKNIYFLAFFNFGKYCIDIKVISPQHYLIYLLKINAPIDNWTSDSLYTRFLIEYLSIENHIDAVKRSIEYLLDIAQEERIQLSDVFTYINTNKLCHMIIKGKISPWLLYQSKTGAEFLSNLSPDHTNLIFDYINPKIWINKFDSDKQSASEVKTLLERIPL